MAGALYCLWVLLFLFGGSVDVHLPTLGATQPSLFSQHNTGDCTHSEHSHRHHRHDARVCSALHSGILGQVATAIAPRQFEYRVLPKQDRIVSLYALRNYSARAPPSIS